MVMVYGTGWVYGEFKFLAHFLYLTIPKANLRVYG